MDQQEEQVEGEDDINMEHDSTASSQTLEVTEAFKKGNAFKEIPRDILLEEGSGKSLDEQNKEMNLEEKEEEEEEEVPQMKLKLDIEEVKQRDMVVDDATDYKERSTGSSLSSVSRTLTCSFQHCFSQDKKDNVEIEDDGTEHGKEDDEDSTIAEMQMNLKLQANSNDQLAQGSNEITPQKEEAPLPPKASRVNPGDGDMAGAKE